MADFPTTLDAITPEWLTRALASDCGLRGASVASFEAEPIGVGTGFLGVVSRLRLTYDRDAPTAPETIIVKLPSPDPGARMITSTFRHYEKEVRFYEQMAQVTNLCTPTAFFHAFDHESGDFALILEDLAPARCGDQVAGLSIDDVRTAVIALARMQAQWWERPALHVFDWLPCFNDPAMLSLQAVFQQCWQPYLNALGDRVPAELIPVGERLGGMITRILHELTARPCTVVHGDFRADNFFFDRGGEALTVVDWQIVIKGLGAFDLAYLLAGNISVEDRREHENYLVRLYHHHLTENGVKDYDLATCWRDYQTCVLIAWIWPVVAVASLDPANERGVAFFHEWSKRATTAVVDLKAWETLDDF